MLMFVVLVFCCIFGDFASLCMLTECTGQYLVVVSEYVVINNQ